MHKIKTEKYMLQALLNIKKISIFCKKLSFDFNLKQPNLILLPLIGLISGILFQNKWFFSTITLLITTTGVIICTLIAYLFLKYFKKQLILISTLSLTFLMGALSLNINQKIMFNIYKSIPRKNLDLVGTIISKRKNQHPQIREILTLNVQQIKEENNQTFNKTKLKIICYLEKTSNLEPDDKISFNNIRISTPKKETNLSGNNNFQDFLIKEKLAGSIFAKKIEPKLLYRPKYSSRRWFSRRTEQILQSLRRKLSWQSLSLLSCLFLGNKKQGYLKIKRHQFNYWGITHYLARSGIHVVLLVIVWKMLLGLLPIPFYIKHILLFVLSILYCLFSWFSISFFRAILIFFAYEVGKLLNKQTRLLHLLTLICMLVLIVNPMQIFFLDFQLSFLLAFALTLFMKFYPSKNNLPPKRTKKVV